MSNPGLFRRNTKMALLQSHFGNTRHHHFGLPHCSSLSLQRRGKTSSSKKAPLKTYRVSYPIKTSPYVVPTSRKEAPTGNAPMGASPPKACSNQSFSSGGGNQTWEAPGVIFDLTPRGKALETPSPMTLQQPPFFQKILANKQMFRLLIKHYYQWLHSAIHLKIKIG